MLSSQPGISQAAGVSDIGPVSSLAPAVSVNVSVTVNITDNHPGNHMASVEKSSAPDAPPAVSAEGSHPGVVDSDNVQSCPEHHSGYKAADNSGHDLP